MDNLQTGLTHTQVIQSVAGQIAVLSFSSVEMGSMCYSLNNTEEYFVYVRVSHYTHPYCETQ